MQKCALLDSLISFNLSYLAAGTHIGKSKFTKMKESVRLIYLKHWEIITLVVVARSGAVIFLGWFAK